MPLPTMSPAGDSVRSLHLSDFDLRFDRYRLIQPKADKPNELEESWIIYALVHDDGLPQIEVAQMLGRHKSWVNRRMALIERLTDDAREALRLGLLNLNHCNTPLVTEVCAGEITVTDPTHPLFGKCFQLSGLATLPGNVRNCHVEIRSGHYGYVAIASTSMTTGVRQLGSILTHEAITDLVTLYQTVSRKKRSKHEGNRRQ